MNKANKYFFKGMFLEYIKNIKLQTDGINIRICEYLEKIIMRKYLVFCYNIIMSANFLKHFIKFPTKNKAKIAKLYS